MAGINDLLLAISVVLFLGLLVALRKISTLKVGVAELNVEAPEVSLQQADVYDQHDFVIKCISCGKHQVRGDPWLSHEEFLALTRRDDKLGGVCPNCRIPSGS